MSVTRAHLPRLRRRAEGPVGPGWGPENTPHWVPRERKLRPRRKVSFGYLTVGSGRPATLVSGIGEEAVFP